MQRSTAPSSLQPQKRWTDRQAERCWLLQNLVRHTTYTWTYILTDFFSDFFFFLLWSSWNTLGVGGQSSEINRQMKNWVIHIYLFCYSKGICLTVSFVRLGMLSKSSKQVLDCSQCNLSRTRFQRWLGRSRESNLDTEMFPLCGNKVHFPTVA